MPINIKNLAEKAGVSIGTVSLALRNDPRIAEKTRALIHGLAQSLGYVPNNFGRALQSSKSKLVGYLLSDVTASFYSEILQGIGEAAAESGYGVLTAVSKGSHESEARHLRLFQEKRVDGVIVSNHFPESAGTLLSFEKQGIPIVLCSSPSFDKSIPDVIINNRKGGEMAAGHLIGLGHKKIAYVFYWGEEEERFVGCLRTVKKHGLKDPVRCKTENDLRQLLSSKNRPTGIVAYSDFDAIEINNVAKTAGLSIPRDLSVVGFDDLWVAGLPEFNLTTMAQPRKLIGRLSFEILLDRINGKPANKKLLTPELVIRGSTAPPGK